MSGFYLPEGMRPATLEERRRFYGEEFDLSKVAAWFPAQFGRPKFAVIIGRHTKVYPPQYKEDADTTIVIDEYSSLGDVCDEVLEFLPEAVYYDRNVYDGRSRKTGQELAFDLDPENVTCPIHGTLVDKMKRGQGLSFCELELEIVKKQALGLYEFLEGCFSQLKLVYSGRGFHIHVFDEASWKLGIRERRKIARDVKAAGFEIDEWVTTGEMRFIRLPYSLNGLVSRIVVPLKKTEIEQFNPVSDVRCLPAFLRR
ncbi:MAG: DNA primase [Candidatus Bathyarchaeota archaeon]|nr:DNA primase [Candidatus Bathyarchaeota archaeon]